MIKRTIEISGKGNHLAIDQGSLTVRREGERSAGCHWRARCA